MIRAFQHIGLMVPSLTVADRFYRDAGLEIVEHERHLAARCVGRAQDQIVLSEGPSRQLRYIAYSTRAGEMDPLRQRLRTADVPILAAPTSADTAATGDDSIWIRDPDGNFVVIMANEPAPPRASAAVLVNSPSARARKGLLPVRSDRPLPLRLAHMIIFTTDLQRSIDFYSMLGMRLSDRGGDFVAFLRTAGDSDHHVLGLIASDRPGLHHCAFEMPSLDDVMLGTAHLTDRGYRHSWGLGRHVGGSNYFQYTRDPWNSMIEYFWDIDFIPEGMEWEPRHVDPKELLFLWSHSGPPPSDFATNFEQRG